MALLQQRRAGWSRSTAGRGLRLPFGLRLEPIFWQLGIIVCAALLGDAAANPDRVRLAFAAAGLALAVALASRAGPGLIYLLVTWTVALGTVRRLLDSTKAANQTDPLLLVAVGALVMLTAAAAERGAFRDRTRLASAVLIFNVLTFFEAFNPKQGSLRAGVTGLAFLLVPALAFWIGRGLCNQRSVTMICRLLGGLAIVVAIYGLIQTFVAFPSWDQRWIVNSGYSALNVDKVIRAFGSFSSSQEYAVFLSVGIVVWFAYGLRPRRALLTAAACALLFVALFYESSRTPLVLTIFAGGLMLAATRARKPVVVLILGAAAVALVPFLISHFGPSSTATGTDRLAAHQVNGLVHPFNSQASTLSTHLKHVVDGFRIMWHNPLGLGVSVINIAGVKANVVSTNTEYDPSNVAVALGVPGLLAYLVIVVEGFKLAIRRAGVRRDFAARAALGIIAVTFLEWTNGGLYSVAFLPWLMLGWLDRDATGSEDLLPAQAARDLTRQAPTAMARAFSA
jgi:hypothetical protein